MLSSDRCPERLLRLILALSAVLLTPHIAFAQAPRGSGAPSAQALQQMQQLATERTQLQAENARLKQELAKLKKDAEQATAGQTTLDRRLRAAEAASSGARREREDLSQQLATERTRMQELVQRSRELVDNLRRVETEKTTATRSLGEHTVALGACVDRNAALYQLGTELADRLERQGAWTKLAASEPFTQLKRNQLENLAQDYRQKIEDSKAAPSVPEQPPKPKS